MKKQKAIFKKIFCPQPIQTALLAFLGYGFVILVFMFDIQNPVLRYASFLTSAYALIITITGLP